MDNKTNIVGESSIVLYTSIDNTIQLEVQLENETVWLSVEQMATLFGRDRTVITRHINNAFKEGEVDKTLGCAKFAYTKDYGRHPGYTQKGLLDYYNLDVIISVGYRVKSQQGVAFRKWAMQIIKDYIVKGYAVRDQLQLQHYNELKNIVGLMSAA